MIKILLGVYAFLIFSVPIVAAGTGPLLATSGPVKLIFLVLAAPIYGIVFILVAGSLSRFTAKAIVPGTFNRDLSDPVYGPRRLWALCWTAVYYFTPLYFLAVSFGPLRKVVFRLFGYKGPLNFTLAPDVWLRDVPLLNLEEGCYIANLATMGTNICMTDNKTFVHGIKVGPKGMVGHRCIVGPGAKIGADVEASINTMVGIRTRLDPKTKLASRAGINHGVYIHENVDIGASSYIGLRAIIGKNIRVPAGANIPSGAKIEKQSDLDVYVSSETLLLNKVRVEGLERLFEEDTTPPSTNNKTNDVA